MPECIGGLTNVQGDEPEPIAILSIVVSTRRPTMTRKKRTAGRDPGTADVELWTGTERVPARPHDSGSGANETVDGLDSATETLRHAAEDTPSGADPDDVEKTPVFDRADLAPKI
jgi:hypothetical protein